MVRINSEGAKESISFQHQLYLGDQTGFRKWNVFRKVNNFLENQSFFFLIRDRLNETEDKRKESGGELEVFSEDEALFEKLSVLLEMNQLRGEKEADCDRSNLLD